MHQMTEDARTPLSLAAGQGNGQGSTTVISSQSDSTPFRPVALEVTKRGRPCIIAKIVNASPLSEIVLAMPYRNRQIVQHVSIPPAILTYARNHGARYWLVRLDTQAKCFAFPLANVEKAGWLKPSDGSPEWFVPLARFKTIPWQSWEYVEDVVRLDALAEALAPVVQQAPVEQQLGLW